MKVLDFGLAKALQPEVADPNMSLSPTMSLTAAATQMGMVIGTAAYMAPEQARGKPVDKRADVWAFGAVLFEMLAGAKTFAGGDVSEVLATVIKTDPDWDALPDETPFRVRTLLRRCLQKDPKQRVADMQDVRLAMGGAFETAVSISSEQAVAPPLRVWQRPVAIAAFVAAALVIGGVVVWALTRPAPDRVARFPMPLADDLTFSNTGRPIVAIAPTGDRVAFTAGGAVWLRPLDQMDATLVSGSEGATNPFFSADGQSLGFYADGQLKRVSVSGGGFGRAGCGGQPAWSQLGSRRHDPLWSVRSVRRYLAGAGDRRHPGTGDLGRRGRGGAWPADAAWRRPGALYPAARWHRVVGRLADRGPVADER